jgi:hypothetical protein
MNWYNRLVLFFGVLAAVLIVALGIAVLDLTQGLAVSFSLIIIFGGIIALGVWTQRVRRSIPPHPELRSKFAASVIEVQIFSISSGSLFRITPQGLELPQELLNPRAVRFMEARKVKQIFIPWQEIQAWDLSQTIGAAAQFVLKLSGESKLWGGIEGLISIQRVPEILQREEEILQFASAYLSCPIQFRV